MSRSICWTLLGLSLFGFTVTLRADDKDKKADPPSSASLTSVGDMNGVLQSADSGAITLRLNQISLQGGGRGKGMKAKENHQDLKLEMTSDCKVRVQHLPTLTDEKGNKKARSPEELQKLKGNSTLPGYMAETSDLKPGQILQVHLVKTRGAGADAKSFVSRILIMGDGSVANPPAEKKSK